MKCPVCQNEMGSPESFIVSEHFAINVFHCEHCECTYELRPEEEGKQAWWKCTKLPVIVDDSDAEYKLYEIEVVCTGEVLHAYPLGWFSIQRDRFAKMSGNSDGQQFELVIAREDEFDEDGTPTFDTDERVLCHQGDCGPLLHLEAAKNVKRWRDLLKM